MSVCVVRSAPEFERCNAVVFWRGKFFEGLRVVDLEGETNEVVRAQIRSPGTRLGQRLARILDLPVTVEVELQPTILVSIAEIKMLIQQAVNEDPETFEEFSGKGVEWWRRTLEASRSVADLMRAIEGSPRRGPWS